MTQQKISSKGPLSSVRILELGHFIAAPFCTRLLADMGADVIKVEPPGAGDPVRTWGEQINGRSIWWSVHGRNKRSVTLNLKHPVAQQMVRELVGHCDIIVENFRPGQMEKWNLGPEDLAPHRRGLVMVRISGAGQNGPERDKASFGVVGEAKGGLRHLCNHPDGVSDLPPVRVGISIGDSLAGMYGALGALAAIVSQRNNLDSKPIVVDSALSESVLSMLEGIIPEYGYSGKIRQPEGSGIATAAPTNAYLSKSGEWLIIAANSDPLFKRLCDVMNAPEMVSDPKFIHNPQRLGNRDELDRIIASWAMTLSTAELLAILDKANIPSSKIYTVADCVEDPQFNARGMFQKVHDPLFKKPLLHPATVPMISSQDRSRTIRWAGPDVGQHNLEVYSELLGMTGEKLHALSVQGIL